MKTQNLNSLFFGGAALIMMPALFFISVILEQFFHNSFLIESIFVPIDKVSGLLSAFIMVGLPFIALCINIIPLIRYKIKKEKDVLIFNLEIKPKWLNILVACFGFIIITITLLYLFTENFRLK